MSRYILCLAVVLCMCPSAVSAEIQDFAYCAALAGDGYDAPVRAAIPREIIARSMASFDDLRIFNDLGEEIEYAVFVQPEPRTVSVKWEVIETGNKGGLTTIILKRKDKEGFVRDIELVTEKGFFHKDVRIFSSRDGESWQYITKGSIADLRPRVNLYDTTVEIPETGASYIRVEIKDSLKKDADPYLWIFLEQTGIGRSGKNMSAVTVKSAVSRINTGNLQAAVYDQALFTQPQTYLDDDGNTIIDLGRVGLPIDEVSLNIADPYFLREVELWISPVRNSSSYILAGRGSIYGIKAYDLKNTTLSFSRGKCSHVMLKVLDSGRTPLSISRVALRWARRDLYFIPLKDRQYALYFGAKDVKAPKYEIQDVIRDYQHSSAKYGSWQMRRAEENETYDPDRLMMERFRIFFFVGFALLVVYILGFWIIQFRNRTVRFRQ